MIEEEDVEERQLKYSRQTKKGSDEDVDEETDENVTDPPRRMLLKTERKPQAPSPTRKRWKSANLNYINEASKICEEKAITSPQFTKTASNRWQR